MARSCKKCTNIHSTIMAWPCCPLFWKESLPPYTPLSEVDGGISLPAWGPGKGSSVSCPSRRAHLSPFRQQPFGNGALLVLRKWCLQQAGLSHANPWPKDTPSLLQGTLRYVEIFHRSHVPPMPQTGSSPLKPCSCSREIIQLLAISCTTHMSKV